jgi:NADPH-dependent 2,4-dienoyl-CoA reductase/sulfur reductase-like enzyme
MSEVAVAGAGVAGLTAAAELAGAGHRVTVLDRVPVTGGVLGYKLELVRELTARAASSGVTFTLGTTALRWRDGRLLAAGPAGIAWTRPAHLVVCTGHRPQTLAEMQVGGARLSGVLPVTAAVHLLESGAQLGRRIAVLGDGWWSRRLAAHVGSGTAVIGISPALAAPLDFATERWPGWRATRLRGTDRVTGVFVTRDGASQLVSCDAVVTAQATVPYRNVDGALQPAPSAPAFVQPLASTAEHTIEAAREAVAIIASQWGGN